ncbi:hypothetical protein V8G54_030049 [Vigna mungo]|uniref:Uncharacterized protein n=1 Tax=Vigna mungo TaxID=3915 RepID=A0AAQ3MVR9_VIGMU
MGICVASIQTSSYCFWSCISCYQSFLNIDLTAYQNIWQEFQTTPTILQGTLHLLHCSNFDQETLLDLMFYFEMTGSGIKILLCYLRFLQFILLSFLALFFLSHSSICPCWSNVNVSK